MVAKFGDLPVIHKKNNSSELPVKAQALGYDNSYTPQMVCLLIKPMSAMKPVEHFQAMQKEKKFLKFLGLGILILVF